MVNADNQLCEDLIDVWLNLSSTLWNRRVSAKMAFNELLICNLLKRQMDEDPSQLLAATNLCEKTRLYKSQMNKVLNSMETKGYIRRIRSTEDKRFVYIQLCEKGLNEYFEEHASILHWVHELINRIGTERIEHTIENVNEIAEELKDLIKFEY